MKKLFILLLLVYTTTTEAKNFYLSANGNDANDGLTTATSWKSISKLNASFNLIAAGDAILFNSGDTFYGSISIPKSGVNGNPIKISSYGSGAQPIITGFTTISAWTNEGGGIYSKIISAAAQTNMVTVDGVQRGMGRYPDLGTTNGGWLTIDSYNSNLSITDAALSGQPNWLGAEVVIRKNDFSIDRCTITSYANNTITYTSKGSAYGITTAGFGYFIQNDLRTLTTYGEWYHNTGNGKFYMYFGSVDPNQHTVKVATINNLISSTGAYTDITFDNLNLQGSIGDIVQMGDVISGGSSYRNDRWIIQNNSLNFGGKHGIEIGNAVGNIINNNIINIVNNIGIVTKGNGTIITNNVVTNICMIDGQALSQYYHNAIYTDGNATQISYNKIKNIGGSGIFIGHYGTGNTTTSYNRIDSVMLLSDDGGGIYTAGPSSNVRTIDHNIISNSIGNSIGTNNTTSVACGIYVDEPGQGVVITNNIVFDLVSPGTGGLKMHRGNTNQWLGNTVYNCDNAMLILNSQATNSNYGNTLKRNIFCAKTAVQNVLMYSSRYNDMGTFANSDSNYWARPINDNLCFQTNEPATGYVSRSLATWASFTGKDAHSKRSPVAITDLNNMRFEYNATKVPVTITLDALYTGMDATKYDGKITLQPFTAAVLIKIGAATVTTPPTPITVSAGANSTLTLPVNSTTLQATTNVAVTNYSWTKIAGPTQYIIASPTTQSTNITNLAAGIYTFQLKVKNATGDSAVAVVNVTVLAAVISTPIIVSAGANNTLTLPVSGTTLQANTNVAISNYSWTKIAGPTQYTIASPTTQSTDIANLAAGIYTFQLKVKNATGDSAVAVVNVTVLAAVVTTPIVVSAGANSTLTLPVNGTTLQANTNVAISNYSWMKIAGPTQYTIASPTTQSTVIANLVTGIYTFQLKVKNAAGDSAVATVNVTVLAAVTISPIIVSAGANSTLTLPTNTTILRANTNIPITNYSWTKIAGPTQYGIASPFGESTYITNLVAGKYTFQLKVKNTAGDSAMASVDITVVAATIATPITVSAGANSTLTLPNNSMVLTGSSNTAVANYSWTKTAGPGQYTIATPTVASTSITNLIAGVYTFQLKVKNATGDSAIASVNVTVLSAPTTSTIIVSAGANTTLFLPNNTMILRANTNIRITNYSWTKIAGPTQYAIASPTGESTYITNLVAGKYTFQLKVKNSTGDSATATVDITVVAAAKVSTNQLNGISTKEITCKSTLETPSFTLNYQSLSTSNSNLKLNVNSNTQQKMNIVLVDVNGRIILTMPVQLQSGINTIEKHVNNINTGIYYVKLMTAELAITKPVLSTN